MKNTLAKKSLLQEKMKLLKTKSNDLNTLVEKLLIESKTCKQCEIYKTKNNELTKALQGFTNSKINWILC